MKNPRYRRPLFAFERRGPYDFGLPVFGIYVNFIALAIFVGIFALLAGLTTAVALTAAFLIHEAGHAVAFRRRGILVDLSISPPLGMAIVPRYACRTQADEIDVALYGPLFGLGSATVGFALWFMTGWAAFREFAMLACWLNLFNLIPVGMLDGGRVIKTLASATGYRRLGFAAQTLGMVILVLLALFSLLTSGLMSSIIIVIVTGYVAVSYYREYQEFKAWRPPPPPRLRLVGKPLPKPRWSMSPSAVVNRVIAYIGMVAFYIGVISLFLL